MITIILSVEGFIIVEQKINIVMLTIIAIFQGTHNKVTSLQGFECNIIASQLECNDEISRNVFIHGSITYWLKLIKFN